MSNTPKFCFLSGNSLKIIAAVAMLFDHVGLLFFPNVTLFRIIGRLAFPIFAFMIAEGARYTKNKLRYFLSIFLLALVCQIVYYVFDESLYMCVLVTFSLSILVLYALDFAKKTLFADGISAIRKTIAVLIFLFSIASVYVLNLVFEIDYGFWGCMLPVFAGLFHLPQKAEKRIPLLLDSIPARVLTMGIGLVPLALEIGWVQPYSFFALLILFLYSGKRGKRKMKYFFYIFYPLHLALLEGIYLLTYYW